jgi:hypothetical protein
MRIGVLMMIAILCLIVFSSGCTTGTGNSSSNTQISQSTGFPVSEAPNLAYQISTSTGNIQNIQYKGVTLSMNQCIYILSRAIVMINSGENGNIPIKSFGNAESPSGTVSSVNLAKSEYVDMAGRTYQWMDQNGAVPNHIGIYQAGAGDLAPDLMLKTFVKVLTDYKSNGKLPASVSVS